MLARGTYPQDADDRRFGYWLRQHAVLDPSTPAGTHALGCESDPEVYQLNKNMRSIIGLPIDFVRSDYVQPLSTRQLAKDALLVGSYRAAVGGSVRCIGRAQFAPRGATGV